MGKERFYWGGSGSRSTKRGRSSGGEKGSSTTPGCMCAVLQLFDIHQFQFAVHDQQLPLDPDNFPPEEPTVLKGVEAPRNSLELEEPFMAASSSSSSAMKEQQNLNIPVGIQIKTSGGSTVSASSARTDDLSLEFSSSPGTKTPNLVARLMGLDLLPESSFPCLSSTSNPLPKSHLHPRVQNLKQEYQSRQMLQCRSSGNRSLFDAEITGTRSLPETPRISSARRSDVDHRLSVQINKENVSVSEEFEFSSYSTPRSARRRELKQEDENRGQSNYGRQIVKQVRESVSRRVGLDITNTTKNRDEARDLPAPQLKSRKASKSTSTRSSTGDELSPSKQLSPYCSPRLRFLEPKNKPVITPPNKNQNFRPSLSSSSADNHSQPTKLPLKLKAQPVQVQQQHQNSTQKRKKAVSEHFTERLKKPPQTSETMRNKQEEPFVRSRTINKKCKKIPLSNDLLNINVPTLLTVKKDPSPPETKLPQKQGQKQSQVSDTLSSCYSSYLYEQKTTHTLAVQDISNDDRSKDATTGDGAEFQYISRIIKCTGIDRNTPVSGTRWYSSSHPLDPSIFHLLELLCRSTAVSQLSHRCNRKLLFQLVDEILVELLKPYLNLKPWLNSISDDYQIMNGSQLIDKLFAKIQSFPSADCRVLEDIDALIDIDLCKYQQPLQRSTAFEEEGEAIVSEIERDIVDSLVKETAMEVFGVA